MASQYDDSGENEDSTLSGALSGGMSGAAIGAAAGAPVGGVGAIPGAAIGFLIGAVGGGLMGNHSANRARKAKKAAMKQAEDARKREAMREFGAKQQADQMALAGLSKSNNSAKTSGSQPSVGPGNQGFIGSNMTSSNTPTTTSGTF